MEGGRKKVKNLEVKKRKSKRKRKARREKLEEAGATR
jgi:hypothetical protein